MYFIKHKRTLTLVYTVDLLREARLKSLRFREREGCANLQAIYSVTCLLSFHINKSVFLFLNIHFSLFSFYIFSLVSTLAFHAITLYSFLSVL